MATELEEIQNLKSSVAELRTLVVGILDEYVARRIVGERTGNKLWGQPEVEARALGAPVVEVKVKSYGPASFLVEGSFDGVSWALFDTIAFSRATEDRATYVNAYPVVRVRTTAPHEIEIIVGR